MMNNAKQRLLPPFLILAGITSLAGYPLSVLWPSGWDWGRAGDHYLHMLFVVYGVLGIFLLLASRNPNSHRSLLQFTAWSSVAHGGLMAFQSFSLHQHGHLMGDVAAMLGLGIGLLILMPASAASLELK